MRGRVIPRSIGRQLIVDVMHLAVRTPTVTEGRRLKIGPLVTAREQSSSRPRWITMFIKACAILAQEMPELRRAYLLLPRSHFYEYEVSVALIYVIRRDDTGAPFTISYTIEDPASLALSEIDRRITEVSKRPLNQIKELRQMGLLARLPRLVRRCVIWFAYNNRSLRPKYFGTFTVTAPPPGRLSGWLSVLAARISYGPIADDGTVDVNAAVDHRIVDGPTGSKILVRLEQILNKQILDEIRAA